MKHTVEELGERADDMGDGEFYIRQRSKSSRDDGKHWEAVMDRRGYRQKGYGHTPDEAVQKLLNKQEGNEDEDEDEF